MSDFLVNHAVQNVWCNPQQDLQVTYKPQRISNRRGVRGRMSHMWTSVTMPTPTDVYHVYQIGQYQPFLVGLAAVQGRWRSLAEMMNENFLFSDVYTLNGLHLSRFHTYVLVTPEQNVLVAIRDQVKVADLRSTEIYLRLYSNAFFSTPRSDGYPHSVVCRGARVMNTAQALNLQRDYLELKARPVGHAWIYVNGYYRDDYRPSDFAAGDYVEYVYDSSVKAVKEFNVSDLPTFDSVLDSKRKFLLHYPGEQVGGVTIDYRDDIDIYLHKPSATAGRFRGVYFHKNNNDAFRQVTHRDYALTVDYVRAHQQAMVPQGWTDINQLKVTLFIRHAGYKRPLVFEHHRIQELYKLPSADIAGAMLGLDSTVKVWRAEELENSEYVKIMDSRKRFIQPDLVKDAYGYNATAKLLGDTPSKVQNMSGRKAIALPYGAQVDSTAFEIDAAGKLIASYIHTSGVEYTTFNPNCTLVEMIVGRGGQKMDMVFNKQDTPINPKYSYRFYVAPIAHGELRNDQWTDVTGDETKYQIINGKVRWFVDLQYNAVCVKSDAYFLNYELTQAADNGVLRFSVNGTADWNGQQLSSLMYIPPGRLDVWLNNEVLIEGLDYFVKWPQVVITNKQYLKDGQPQKLRIRGTGFCNADMSRQPAKEFGFVRWGKLSRNNRYDLRDDRVIRLVVNGRTFHRDDVYFTEQDPALWMNNVPNGAPYLLDDLIVPLRAAVSEDTYVLRARSLEVDKSVSDYLTMKLPEPVPANPDPILERYAVYSPFAASIMYDLLTERLSTEKFRGQYSDQEVRDYLRGYEWLLEYDPTRHDLDLKHVAVHPHERLTVIELDAYQYFLLNRAIKVFLEDKVDITSFVRIKSSFL